MDAALIKATLILGPLALSYWLLDRVLDWQWAPILIVIPALIFGVWLVTTVLPNYMNDRIREHELARREHGEGLG